MALYLYFWTREEWREGKAVSKQTNKSGSFLRQPRRGGSAPSPSGRAPPRLSSSPPGKAATGRGRGLPRGRGAQLRGAGLSITGGRGQKGDKAGSRRGRDPAGRALGAYPACRSHSRSCAPPGRVHVKRRPFAPPSLPSLPPVPVPSSCGARSGSPGPPARLGADSSGGGPRSRRCVPRRLGLGPRSPRRGHEPTPVGGGGGGTGVASGESQEEGLGQVPQLLASVGDRGSVHRDDDAGRGRGRRGGPSWREAAGSCGARSVRGTGTCDRGGGVLSATGRGDRTPPTFKTRVTRASAPASAPGCRLAPLSRAPGRLSEAVGCPGQILLQGSVRMSQPQSTYVWGP